MNLNTAVHVLYVFAFIAIIIELDAIRKHENNNNQASN